MATFSLHEVEDWTENASCTPTALAALTGRPLQEIGELLAEIAAENGRAIGPELRADYAPQDWAGAVNRLGGDWVVAEEFRDREFSDRPSINEWMETHLGVEPELVVCYGANNIGHVFATFEGDVVDTYTEGKRVHFTGVPIDFEFLKVAYTLLVEPLVDSQSAVSTA
ncbi:MAG: hypothetical protein E5X34_29795 [Mesorhizobium sp.]|uniref:hypothetical protein n=1 Tax=Mesorhizobium sp. TaxID=1871066 RepID=UPI0012199E39|nr:hypothetical protein [Mesorhizobium sp.]TIR15289.1 MAG: hypothetical protein E5X34_29795 [Mesorhizobium sp.]